MTKYIQLYQKPRVISFTQFPNFCESPGYRPLGSVDALRELQYAGLLEIRMQGCGKPNRIYPKWHKEVPDADFKKSGHGTPEDGKPYSWSIRFSALRIMETGRH